MNQAFLRASPQRRSIDTEQLHQQEQFVDGLLPDQRARSFNSSIMHCEWLRFSRDAIVTKIGRVVMATVPRMISTTRHTVTTSWRDDSIWHEAMLPSDRGQAYGSSINRRDIGRARRRMT